MPLRERYMVTAHDLESLKTELNFQLQSIADRLDRIEGIRGKPELSTEGITVAGAVSVNDEDDNLIHSFK